MWVTDLFHSFPRFDTRLSPVDATFQPGERGYLEALAFWVLLPCALLVLLLAVVWCYWCSHCCCTKGKSSPKRQRGAKQHLANGLFVINVACCLFVGLSLYGNEQISRGLDSTNDNIQDLGVTAEKSLQQAVLLNRTLAANVTRGFERLRELAEQVFRHRPQYDKEHGRVIRLVRTSEDRLVNASQALAGVGQATGEIDGLAGVNDRIRWIEFDRWIISLILLCFILLALLLGLVAFCRRSRSTSILFSTVGVLVFVLNWLLVAVYLGICLAVSDLCTDSTNFIVSQVDHNSTKEIVRYFLTSCNTSVDHSALNPLASTISNLRLDLAMSTSNADEIKLIMRNITQLPDITAVLVALKDSLSYANQKTERLAAFTECSYVAEDIYRAEIGFCWTTISGAALLLLGLLANGVMIFFLLLLVSKTWTLFKTRRPLDYVEVDDQDPFLPRSSGVHSGAGGSVSMTADFYGTHMYNPRSRDLSISRFGAVNRGADDGEGGGRSGVGGGEERAGGLIGARTSSNYEERSDNEGLPGTPLWLRSSPPPAYESLHRERELAQAQARSNRSRSSRNR